MPTDDQQEFTDFSAWGLDPEWLAESDARLRQQAKRQSEYEAISERTYGDMFRGGDRYAPSARQRTTWLVEGLLPLGYLTILGAASKTGKSALATALAMSVATGQPFLGQPVTPGAVLWCAFEESEDERLHILRQWPEIPHRLYTTHQRPYIDDEEGLAALRYWVYKTEAKLIVIDPLCGATVAETLSDSRAARRALTGLKDICERQRCTALVLHHITKDVHAGMVRERFADSHQLLATASMDILMDASEIDQGERLLRLSCRGRGDFANRTLLVRSSGITDYRLLEDPAEAQILTVPVDARILSQLRHAGCPLSAISISKALSLNVKTIRNRLTELHRLGQIQSTGKENRAILYSPTAESAPVTL